MKEFVAFKRNRVKSTVWASSEADKDEVRRKVISDTCTDVNEKKLRSEIGAEEMSLMVSCAFVPKKEQPKREEGYSTG